MRRPAASLVGVALALASADAGFASALRYEDGIAAYNRNDYDASLKALRPLAEKGDARAQYMLGRHYQFGQSVKADRAEAYYWYRKAESRGHLEAKLFRMLLEKRWKLTADEKAAADRRLTEANAPKVAVRAEPKPKPEKPKIEATPVAREPARPKIEATPVAREPARPKIEATPVAREPARPKIEATPVAREPARPAIAAKAAPPEKPVAAKPAALPPKPTVTARPATPSPPAVPHVEMARVKPPERPAVAVVARGTAPAQPLHRSAPPEDARVPAHKAERVLASRPAPKRIEVEREEADASDLETDDRRLPAETSAPVTPRAPAYVRQPAYSNAPVYSRTPTHPKPDYPPPQEPDYESAQPPPPTWRPPGYYSPYAYAPPYAPGWTYRPHPGYLHPGWRATASWGPYPGPRYRRFPGY